MSSGFETAMAFAVVMALRDADREREAQRQKEKNFYQKCYEEMSAAISDVVALITDLCNDITIYLPSVLGDGMQLFPLYCCGLVLRHNGRITK